MEEGDKTEIGITSFAPFPAPSYRYVASSKGNQLSISLEDYKTKKKWSTGYLDEAKYLAGTNRILQATAANYVSVFHGALEYMMGFTNGMDDAGSNSGDDSSYMYSSENDDDDDEECKSEGEGQTTLEVDPEKIRRRLTLLENDVLELELWAKIRVHGSAWSAKYVFRLELVPLDRTDILEARIRDLEAELAATKTTIAEQKDKELLIVAAKTAKPAQKNKDGKIRWVSVQGQFASLSNDEYEIKILFSGTYIVTVKVQMELQPMAGCEVELRVNGDCIESDHATANLDRRASASLVLTVHLLLDDNLTLVTTNAPTQFEATLTAAKIGA